MTKARTLMPNSPARIVLLITGLCGLVAVYLHQDISYVQLLHIPFYSTWVAFVVDKLIRFLLNDGCTLCVVFSLYQSKKYRLFALYVQLFGLFVLFPMYILVKFHWGDTYRNLDANLHRIIMNPILLMLLIPAFYLQHQNSELGKS